MLLILGAIAVPLIPYLYLRKFKRAAALFGASLALGFGVSFLAGVFGVYAGLDDAMIYAIGTPISLVINIGFRIWLVMDVLRIAKEKELAKQSSQQ